MVVKIFIDKPIAPDELSGLIDAQGQIFSGAPAGGIIWAGWITMRAMFTTRRIA